MLELLSLFIKQKVSKFDNDVNGVDCLEIWG